MSGSMQMLLGGATKFVKLSNKNESDSELSIIPDSSSTATVTFTFSNTGLFTCDKLNFTDVTYTGEWLVTGVSSNWEIRFTGTGWSSGTFGSWLSLGTSRSISVTISRSTIGESTNTVNCTVEIRRIGGTANEASCTLTANVTAVIEP